MPRETKRKLRKKPPKAARLHKKVITMSMKRELSEKAKKTQKEIKISEGQREGVSSTWAVIVEDYCKKVHEAAEVGDEKKFFDMKEYNQATITKVSIELKQRLGDVLIIVSPRGIEANWEIYD